MEWRLADRTLDLARPIGAGIVNVTIDSMFEGARSGTPEQAVRDGLALADAGFEMLDVGAVAAKSGPAVPPDEEAAALVPASASVSQATLQIESTVPGADIEIDGAFAGNTPSTLTIAPGHVPELDHRPLPRREALDRGPDDVENLPTLQRVARPRVDGDVGGPLPAAIVRGGSSGAFVVVGFQHRERNCP